MDGKGRQRRFFRVGQFKLYQQSVLVGFDTEVFAVFVGMEITSEATPLERLASDPDLGIGDGKRRYLHAIIECVRLDFFDARVQIERGNGNIIFSVLYEQILRPIERIGLRIAERYLYPLIDRIDFGKALRQSVATVKSVLAEAFHVVADEKRPR